MRILPLFFLLLAACPTVKDDETGGTACTELAAVSVSVSVVDPAGDPLAPTAVTWSVDGAAPEAAQCWNEACTEFAAGTEIAGEITVTATLSGPAEEVGCVYDSEASQTVTVEMDAEGCHVVGKQVTLTLDPSLQHCVDTG